ncbi:hypothetical protein I552_4709 [Mycobacterium xenopi 3993]|nr:hypothetical protein I552_4709 [Mycobacterium xenopi 3993]
MPSALAASNTAAGDDDSARLASTSTCGVIRYWSTMSDSAT